LTLNERAPCKIRKENERGGVRGDRCARKKEIRDVILRHSNRAQLEEIGPQIIVEHP